MKVGTQDPKHLHPGQSKRHLHWDTTRGVDCAAHQGIQQAAAGAAGALGLCRWEADKARPQQESRGERQHIVGAQRTCEPSKVGMKSTTSSSRFARSMSEARACTLQVWRWTRGKVDTGWGTLEQGWNKP